MKLGLQERMVYYFKKIFIYLIIVELQCCISVKCTAKRFNIHMFLEEVWKHPWEHHSCYAGILVEISPASAQAMGTPGGFLSGLGPHLFLQGMFAHCQNSSLYI